MKDKEINVHELECRLITTFDEIMVSLPTDACIDVVIMVAFSLSQTLASYALVKSLRFKDIAPNSITYINLVDSFLRNLKTRIDIEKEEIIH